MEKIIRIINEWDPLGLFPLAPRDEYVDEATKIYEYINNNKSITIQQLAQTIHRIFLETFGQDIYEEDMQKCIFVAEKILNLEQ